MTADAAVADLRGVAGGDVAGLVEGRAQRGEGVGGRVAADALVGVEHDGVTPALRDRHRRDLLGEQAVLDGPCRPLVARRGQLVLRRPVEAGRRRVLLGRAAHGELVEGAEQAVVGQRVDEGRVAVLEAGPAAGQQVRRLGHRLHAAGDDDLGLAGLDGEVGEVDRVETRQADLVDRRRRARSSGCRPRPRPGGR